jgi:hypothetical protein
MRIEEKVTTFAINEASWIVWLLIGLSMGVTVGLARALSLLLGSRALRRARAWIAGVLGRSPGPACLRPGHRSRRRATGCQLCRA